MSGGFRRPRKQRSQQREETVKDHSRLAADWPAFFRPELLQSLILSDLNASYVLQVLASSLSANLLSAKDVAFS